MDQRARFGYRINLPPPMHQSLPAPPTESDIFIYLRDGEHRPRFSYHSSFHKTASELARLVPGYTALRVRHGIRVLIDEICPAGDYVLFPNIRPTAIATSTQVVPQISPRATTQSNTDKLEDAIMENGHELNPQQFPILELQAGNPVIEVWFSLCFCFSFSVMVACVVEAHDIPFSAIDRSWLSAGNPAESVA